MVLQENKHYEIIPDKADDQAWNVRILSGTFTETVLKYGVVKFNGKKKDMTFNFDIVYTPDTELEVSNKKLQEFAGIMLEQIMAQGIKEGSVITKEIENENDN
tara:strand:+ start:108 stop:416 length:309 start_codon:yes stop_codon:yes gene_type:complete